MKIASVLLFVLFIVAITLWATDISWVRFFPVVLLSVAWVVVTYQIEKGPKNHDE